MAISSANPTQHVLLTQFPPECDKTVHGSKLVYAVNPCDGALYLACWDINYHPLAVPHPISSESFICPQPRSILVTVNTLHEVSRAWKQTNQAEIDISGPEFDDIVEFYSFSPPSVTGTFDSSGNKFAYLMNCDADILMKSDESYFIKWDFFLIFDMTTGGWIQFRTEIMESPDFHSKNPTIQFSTFLDRFVLLRNIWVHKSLDILKIECNEETGKCLFVPVHKFDVQPDADPEFRFYATTKRAILLYAKKPIEGRKIEESFVCTYDFDSRHSDALPLCFPNVAVRENFNRIYHYQHQRLVTLRPSGMDNFSVSLLDSNLLNTIHDKNFGTMDTFHLERHGAHFELVRVDRISLCIRNLFTRTNYFNPAYLTAENAAACTSYPITQDPHSGVIHFSPYFCNFDDSAGAIRFHGEITPLDGEPERLKILAGRRVRELFGSIPEGVSLEEMGNRLGISSEMTKMCFF